MRTFKVAVINLAMFLALIWVYSLEARADEYCPSQTPGCGAGCADGPLIQSFYCCSTQGENCCQYLCQKYQCVADPHGPCPDYVVCKIFGNLHLNKSCQNGNCRVIE